ncbi:MAG: fused MFS/spermidine synthase [Formivibrio sp.]|nr:fused MFS/spermidine synthase [Formivibrio sp.]
MSTLEAVSAGVAPGVGEERGAPRLVAGAMVFLGAFLSFSMEPIVGRMVTPFFGGAVHVWTVSLMIFQALLLLGYLYAHLVAPRIGAWHLLILFLPLLQWPLGFTSEIAPKAPIVTLVGALLTHISLPFAVLSTTAVVAQSWWYGASSMPRRSAPFFLYGISNLGAMVALFTYPFLVEPLFGVNVQRWAWSISYLLYAAVATWAWFLLHPESNIDASQVDNMASPARLRILRWLALGAAPSALLLAVTNVIAMEVGSFPLVWVFPLALYLASFIITFREQQGGFVRRASFWLIDIALLALLAARATVYGAWVLPFILFSFYALCVIANQQLYRLRPHPSQLTIFYLTIAVGGWLGGVLVSLAAPMIFSGLEEYPLAVLAIVVASWQAHPLAWWQSTSRLKGGLRLCLLMIGGTVFGLFFWHASAVYSLRNFYGISRVIDPPAMGITPPYRMLVHGTTLHGLQYLQPSLRKEPLGYYYNGGALEIAVSQRNRTAPTAMVGLGAGDALAWFGAGEAVTVFEIDPDMEGLARHWFSYLADTPAKVRVRVGDARLNLAEEAQKKTAPYGVIFVDAFSGDGVPTHLLTLEAMDVYLSRLAEDGILVFHVSNRFYDLRPVIKAAARARGLAAVIAPKPRKSFDKLHIDPWVVALARQPDRLTPLLAQGWTAVGNNDGLGGVRVWTDDYVNILAPLSAMWLR